jgi:hypothetical protein
MWKTIEGFENYEISNDGLVRRGSLIMKYFDNGLGYKVIKISHDKRRFRFYVHRLVVNTFLPNKTGLRLEVNHIDHNKANNNIENLEWVTHKSNLQKAVIALGAQAFCAKSK